MDGGASAAAAAGSIIRVNVMNLAGHEEVYDFHAGATVADLMQRAVTDKFLGETTSLGKLRVNEKVNGDWNIVPLARSTPLNDGGEYNILQISYQPGNLLRIYGPAQGQVQYFNPPDEHGVATQYSG